MALLTELGNTIFGIEIGPKLEQTANDWCNANVFPDRFTGTLAQLTALMGTQAQSCATYVQNETLAYNKAEAITACQAKLQQRYATVLQQLQGQQKQVQDSITNSIIANAGAGKNVYVLAGIGLLVVVLLILLFIK